MHGTQTYARVNREQELREENSFLRKQAREARRDGTLAAYDTVLAWLDSPPESPSLLESTRAHLRTLRESAASTI